MPVGHGIVERIADRLQEARLLPAEEYNDGLILAEAALLGCAILLTGDSHLRGMDFQRASLELKAFDVEMPVIATPREIVARFFSDSISLRLHLPPASIAAHGGARLLWRAPMIHRRLWPAVLSG